MSMGSNDLQPNVPTFPNINYVTRTTDVIDQQSNILGIKYIKYVKHIGTPNDLVHRDAARSRSRCKDDASPS